jgi:hypothetical protein
MPYLSTRAPQLVNAAKRHGTIRVRNPKPPPSATLRYYAAVFQHAIRIADDFNRIEHIVSMTRSLPARRTLKKWKLTADQWLELQYSLFLVTVVGTVDRSLILASVVLQLGLAPQDCTEQTLSRHARVARTRLAVRIKRLVNELKSLRTLRNLDIHQRNLPPFHSIVGWDGYDWLPAYALLERTGNSMISAELLHAAFRYSGQTLAMKMQKERTRLKTQVWRLLTVLTVIAEQEVNRLAFFDKLASGERLTVTGSRSTR